MFEMTEAEKWENRLMDAVRSSPSISNDRIRLLLLQNSAPNLPGEPLWTVAEVASFLNMSESWVYKRSTDNSLPYIKVGGSLRFKPEEIRGLSVTGM